LRGDGKESLAIVSGEREARGDPFRRHALCACLLRSLEIKCDEVDDV